MSLAWRILLFALLLNVLTVGSVQVVVHEAQQRWFERQRELLQDTVQDSFEELERVYTASALDDAAANYRHALRSAIRAGSMQGEAVACGNLAIVSKQSGDLEAARACLDRYLQLTEALRDSVGAVEAHQRLGDLATQLGDLQSAGSHFESALNITTTQPDQQAALNATKIEIGLAQGDLQFSEWMLTGWGAMKQ